MSKSKIKRLKIQKKKRKHWWLNIIEYAVMNDRWDGYKMGRIELHKEGEPYAVYEGFLRLPTNAFDALREELDMKEFDKLPLLRFNYEKENDE